ncbi:porin [Colwellia sp. D2M02]|uniref:Porin domain-containing protein n=1 Tax=Colwellia asteriadis TaxID=517723 RepID=A0ABN1L678_9GAMM|nr:porin [Colwellia sp. D2M02]MBU2893818.1 porin [Colwellia sp. D2M02]
MKHTCKALIVTSALFAGNLHAEIVFNGFSSIVGGVTTSSKDELYGYDDSFDFKNDSLFALQASADLTDGIGVTAQIISRGKNDWDVDFEWAYISYDATDDLRFLVGRQRAPFYMYSDFLDVSYAYTWITPPAGVYDLIFDTFDGVGAIYSTSLGEFDSTFQVMYGRNTDKLDVFGETVSPDFKDLLGGSFTLTRDWLTLRAGIFQADTTIPHSGINEIAYGWQQAGFTDVASDVLIEEDKALFVELGFQLDFENFLIVGEYTELTLDDMAIADEESYYVMAGWRFSNMLLHVTYGVDENSKNDLTAGVPWGLDPGIDFLKASTQGLVNQQKADESYITLGLRWNFHESAALKFEYTDFSDDLNSLHDAGVFRTALVTVF